jgi:DsbC/DsbD-like thiol-disulfide interchange protein
MRKIATAAAAALILCLAWFSRLSGTSLFAHIPEDGISFSPVKSVEILVLDPGAFGPGMAGGSGAGVGEGLGPALDPGSVRLGLVVELEAGWHLYWANPGDAGLAPVIRWTLPPGSRAGPLVHPVPVKTAGGGIVSFEHESPVLLLCDIAPAPGQGGGGAWQASAVLEWMACKESCLTGETAVRASFPPSESGLRRGREVVTAFAPRFPRPLAEAGLAVGTATARRSGGDWLIEIALSGEAAGRAVDFYPHPLEDFVIDHAGISCADGRIALPLTPSRGSGAPPPAKVSGLVIVGGAGYELAAPVAAAGRLPGLQSNSLDKESNINPWRE